MQSVYSTAPADWARNLVTITTKIRIFHLVYFVSPSTHRWKIKESKGTSNYQDLARELKKLWNIKVMLILIVVEALATVLKNLEKRLE